MSADPLEISMNRIKDLSSVYGRFHIDTDAYWNAVKAEIKSYGEQCVKRKIQQWKSNVAQSTKGWGIEAMTLIQHMEDEGRSP